MDRGDSVVFGLLAFPIAVMSLSMFGFAVGLPIGWWQFPVGLLISLGLVYWQSTERKINNVFYVLGFILLGIVLSGAFVLYTQADGEGYHRPALILLANGWNPLKVTEIAAIKEMIGCGDNEWHVAFLPRLGWIFGAALYKWFGFTEIADSINVLLFVGAVIAVRKMFVGWGLSGMVVPATILICVSPVVVRCTWGGDDR